MKEEDKLKTSFISHHGAWQYKRKPMGLRNSPSTFVRCLDTVLGEYKERFCGIYFDDVCVFSQSFEDHVEHIRLVMSKLQGARFTINPSKVQLCRSKFKYLGFIIQPCTCQPNPDKLKYLREYPRPQKPKDMQRFLGFVGFYRRFIPEFATHSKPLTSLLKKGQKFAWSEAAELGFNHLKNSLSDQTMLYMPNMKYEFTIQTDSSDTTVGAVLLQEIDGIRYPVLFASQTRSPAEMNYSTTQKQIRGALYGIYKF